MTDEEAIETPESTDQGATVTAVAPAREKAVQSAPMTPVQRELAATMHGSGSPDADILDRLQITKHQLARLKGTEEFRDRSAQTCDQVAAAVVDHRPSMARLAETARVAIKDIIENSENAKVRLEAARYVLEQAGAATEKVASVDVQVGIQQNHVQVEIAETLRDVTRELPDLFKALAEMDPSKHVRTGDDALPQALLQSVANAEKRAEIVDAEFAEVPEDGEE